MKASKTQPSLGPFALFGDSDGTLPARRPRENPDKLAYAAYRTASTAVHHAIRSAGLGVSTKAHMLAAGNLVARVSQRECFAHQSSELPKSCHVGD
jgi:hypothetical protein